MRIAHRNGEYEATVGALCAQRSEMENIMQTELRKHQHTLIVYGTGTILFSLWSLVKSTILLAMDTSEGSLTALIKEAYDSPDRGIGLMVIAVVVGMIYMVDLVLRWTAGKNAREIGEGKKRIRPGFIISSLYILGIDSLELVTGLMMLARGEVDNFDRVLTILVDITSLVTVLEMVYAAFMVGKLTRRIAQRSSGSAAIRK